jgi:hypothetical protein
MDDSKILEELNWEKLSWRGKLSWGDEKKVEEFKRNVLNGVVETGCSRPEAQFNILRRMGFDKTININNNSGKDAWVVLSPSPIINISSLGIDKIGNLSTTSIGGEIKCQQFGIKNNSKKEYDLDNTKLYYTVFFNCDGKWKCPYKDRKIDAKIYDINLLPKNVDESIDVDFVPK